MMIRRFWILLVLGSLSMGLLAQQTLPEETMTKGPGAGERFVAMPDSLCTLLTAVNRADLVDFMANHMKAEVDNRLSGRTRMTQLSSSYLRLQHSDLAQWQMKLLPTQQGDTLICVVETVLTPVVDSHLLLYDTDWNALPLDRVLPQTPTLSDFLSPEAHAIFQSQNASAALLLTEATFTPDENQLVIRFTTPDSVDAEVRKRLEPYLTSSITYHWQGNRFERSLPQAR